MPSAVASATPMPTIAAVEFAGASTEISAAVKAAIAISEAAVLESLVPFKAAIAISEAAVLESLVPFKAAIAISEAAVLESLVPFKAASIVSASVIAPIVESGTPVEPMKPWARANKDAAYKVVWTVIAVRSASIRVISIVAIGAYRSRAYIGRADSHADNHSLCLRRNRGCKHANGQ